MPFTIFWTLLCAFQISVALQGGLGAESVTQAIIFAAWAGLLAVLQSFAERKQ